MNDSWSFVDGASDALGKPDRQPAAKPYCSGEQRQRGGALGTGSYCGIAVSTFVVAKGPDMAFELGIRAACFEFVELARIVTVDFLLNSHGAGHRRLWTKECGCRTQ